MNWASLAVCTVPGVLSAIASDICYLLKTSGFTIHPAEEETPSWRQTEVKGYTLVNPPPKKMKLFFYNLDLFFHLPGLADVMYASPPHTQKKAIFTLVEKPQRCCGMSRHISRGAPPRLLHGALSATVGEAADTRPLRQMHVAFTAGGALLYFFFNRGTDATVCNGKFLLHRETKWLFSDSFYLHWATWNPSVCLTSRRSALLSLVSTKVYRACLCRRRPNVASLAVAC